MFKENKLYNDKIIINTLKSFGGFDSTSPNDLTPSYAISNNEMYLQIFFANSKINNYDEELFNTTNICLNDDQKPIFQSKDILTILSVIKSNFNYK